MTSNDTSFWTTFMPHGHCYLWRPDILWLNVISDAFIALAYFSIPITLYTVVRQRTVTEFSSVIKMFSLFILACGVTHLFGIWTVWHGNYGVHGLVKSFTAMVSMATAIMLVPLLPKLLTYKSPEKLHALNLELLEEISSQRLMTESLARAEKQFRTFLKQAPDGILIVDNNGVIEYANDMSQTMFGYQSSELRGESVTVLAPERFKHRIIRKQTGLFDDDSAQSLSDSDVIGKRRDGSEFPVEMRISPITSSSGDTFIVNVRDVSSRNAREERTRRDFQKLAHVSRLSTVGQMASGLAHELNQPLTAISTNLHTAMSMQSQKAEPDTELLEMMRENYDSAQRAGEIIRSLRRLVRSNNGSREEADINQLIEATVALLAPEARHAGIELELELADGLPTSFVDSIQIQQVIMNLGRNSLEALTPTRELSSTVRFTTYQQDDQNICVCVTDNGPGLHEGTKANLFKPFSTNKDSGMGLGLSICQSIIESQSGKIWFSDTKISGAEFCFSIPVYNKEK